MKPEWTVAPAEAGVRLDKFLAAPHRAGSRGRAASALEKGKVLLNGEDVGVEDAARRLASGDVIRLWIDRPGTAKTRRTTAIGNAQIVYEDDALWVINKPAGLLTVPLPRREGAASVYDLLEQHLRPHGKRRPLVVHRIDRDTSGLVVFTKDEKAQLEIKEQLKRREPERVYLAVVYGKPTPSSGTWRDQVVWVDEVLKQRRTHAGDPKGKEAVSEYRVVEAFREASLIEVRLHTGKRNQIRLQASVRGHTLVGEQRYVPAGHVASIEFARQALHAFRLGFRHPRDGRALQFEAPLPSDMQALIARLRGNQ